jgi:hypothetical protein
MSYDIYIGDEEDLEQVDPELEQVQEQLMVTPVN